MGATNKVADAVDVSIIVPVYNAAEFLDRCLNSVIKALKFYKRKSEIITVDNDSTDESYKILQKFAKKYPEQIRVLQCHTPGAGAVRNFAVKRAKGKYFWFVDADDAITKDSVKKLMAVSTKNDADFTMLSLAKIYPDGHKTIVPAFDPTKPDFRSRFIRSELGPVQVFIKRKWYLEHDFQFIEGKIHEDMEMMPTLMLYTDKIAFLNEPVYLYYQNPDSTLHKLNWTEHYFDIFPALEGLYKRFRKMNAFEKYHAELEWFTIWNLLWDSAAYYRQFPEGRPGLERSRKMLKQNFPHWRQNKFLKNTNFKTHLKILLNYHAR